MAPEEVVANAAVLLSLEPRLELPLEAAQLLESFARELPPQPVEVRLTVAFARTAEKEAAEEVEAAECAH